MISELQTINRLLASVSILTVDNWAKDQDVEEYYTTQYVYPIRDDYLIARDFCRRNMLLSARENRLRLSEIGESYLNLGEKRGNAFILEPNQKQKKFLTAKVFLSAGMLDQVKKVLYYFKRGADGLWQLPEGEASVLHDQNFLKLLLQLDVLVKRGGSIVLSSECAEFLEKFLSENLMVVTPEMFESAEAEKIEMSRIAEEYVLKNETDRLRREGALQQSKQVDYIARKNVAAGYDIASFVNRESAYYDCFIEVKAGQSTPIRFFLSRNEFETAKRLKKKYYIYYVCMKGKIPQEVFVFKNPVENIMKDPKFTIRTDAYEIFEK